MLVSLSWPPPLSTGYPYGNQAGTIMAMACMGDYNKYGEHFKDRIHLPQVLDPKPIKEIVDNRGEEGQFDISAAITLYGESSSGRPTICLWIRTKSNVLTPLDGLSLSAAVTS